MIFQNITVTDHTLEPVKHPFVCREYWYYIHWVSFQRSFLFLFFIFCNYSALVIKLGHLPSNSRRNASDAATPRFRHVDK